MRKEFPGGLSVHRCWFHSERFITFEIKPWPAFRHDHERGIMIRFLPESMGWTPGCNQQDLQDICERHHAGCPPVMFPSPLQGSASGVRGKYGGSGNLNIEINEEV